MIVETFVVRVTTETSDLRLDLLDYDQEEPAKKYQRGTDMELRLEGCQGCWTKDI